MAEDNVVWGTVFGQPREQIDRVEARMWEDICDKPNGSFRGTYQGVPFFEVPDYIFPESDPA